jgi:hypothetical protein
MFAKSDSTCLGFSSKKPHQEPNRGGQFQTNHEALVEGIGIHLVLHDRRIFPQIQLVQPALVQRVQGPMTISPTSPPNEFVTLLDLVSKLQLHASLLDNWSDQLFVSVSIYVMSIAYLRLPRETAQPITLPDVKGTLIVRPEPIMIIHKLIKGGSR